MSDFIEVGSVVEFDDGEMREVAVDGHELLVARVGEAFYVSDARCPHLHGHLTKGKLEGTVVTCPLHHSQFDLDRRALPEMDRLERAGQDDGRARAAPSAAARLRGRGDRRQGSRRPREAAGRAAADSIRRLAALWSPRLSADRTDARMNRGCEAVEILARFGPRLITLTTVSGRTSVALEGNLKDFSLADMFRLLASGPKTGTLHVEGAERRGHRLLPRRPGLLRLVERGDRSRWASAWSARASSRTSSFARPRA